MGQGKWCLGHGVEGSHAESLKNGHYVKAPHVRNMFSSDRKTDPVKGFDGKYLNARCRICRSIKQGHDLPAKARRRASSWRRNHAARWVAKKLRTDIDATVAEMETGGITIDALAAKLLGRVGKKCPGRCAYEKDGKLHRHTIDSLDDMHVDIKDPNLAQPFSIENVGIICCSCNLLKRQMPWGDFMYRRRVDLEVWEDAVNDPECRGVEELHLFDLALY